MISESSTSSERDQELAQVVLRRERLGEDHQLAAALALRRGLARPHARRRAARAPCCRWRARRAARRSSPPARARLECAHGSGSGPSSLSVVAELVLFLEVLVEIDGDVVVIGCVAAIGGEQATQALRDAAQAAAERAVRGGHATVKADHEQAPLLTSKRRQARREQVAGDVVVERPLLVRHVVLEQACAPADKRRLHELLGLTTQRAPDHDLHATLQILLLPGREHAVIVRAEQLPEGGQIAEQGTASVDVLNQAPQLRERVLQRRRREQQHGRLAAEQHAQATCESRMRRVVDVVPGAIEAPVDAREHLVRFVHHAQIERTGREQLFETALAAEQITTDQKHAGAGKRLRRRCRARPR